jgi:hypothetical protein
MISVLSVNYRSESDVAGLAESIAAARQADGKPGAATPANDLELIVINNSPERRIQVRDDIGYPVRVIEVNNAGYARGVNLAAAAARGDTWFVANPDVRVTAGALAAAQAALRADPGIGVLLPRLLDANGDVQQSVRRFYTWRAALYARCPLRDRIAHPRFFRRYLMLDDDLSAPTDVDWGLGGAMFVRGTDHPAGRVFDERFFLYFEDVDLCLRTWRSGRRVVYNPAVVCRHEHKRASRTVFSTAAWRHGVSLGRFVRKFGGLPGR